MALTFTSTIDGGLRVWNLGNGLKMAQLDMTSSDVSVDYSSGFDIAGNAGKMGFRKIFHVLDATIRAAAGTVRGLNSVWDANAGKLRFAETCINAIDDPEADTDIIDGDIIRMVVIGV